MAEGDGYPENLLSHGIRGAAFVEVVKKKWQPEVISMASSGGEERVGDSVVSKTCVCVWDEQWG